MEAQLLKNLLNSEGIESSILGASLHGATSELPGHDFLRVTIRDDLYEQVLFIVSKGTLNSLAAK